MADMFWRKGIGTRTFENSLLNWAGFMSDEALGSQHCVSLLLSRISDLQLSTPNLNKGVCHTVALPFTFKKYLKAKEELWKLKYFTIAKT